ncbi:MAG TPA: MgtC/SapB family protein [Bryobacteraceae bacterium]|nr:MgtC/SapB family protein [Bryobacteraceae bacterium]
MPITLGWREIALRLALTVLAGALIGFNRGQHGRAAGLRTTMLVCLAASIAMIQTNLLLGTAGKAPNSFIVMDLMRLPLGILSGMGFIGAGAIVRRDDLVLGVTTAATLWFVTVLGLCFGGGQIALGLVSLTLGMIILWLLKWAEELMHRERRATLILTSSIEGPSDEEVRNSLLAGGFRIASSAIAYAAAAQRRELSCEVGWNAAREDGRPPDFLNRLAQHPGVLELQWKEAFRP